MCIYIVNIVIYIYIILIHRHLTLNKVLNKVLTKLTKLAKMAVFGRFLKFSVSLVYKVHT